MVIWDNVKSTQRPPCILQASAIHLRSTCKLTHKSRDTISFRNYQLQVGRKATAVASE